MIFQCVAPPYFVQNFLKKVTFFSDSVVHKTSSTIRGSSYVTIHSQLLCKNFQNCLFAENWSTSQHMKRLKKMLFT